MEAEHENARKTEYGKPSMQKYVGSPINSSQFLCHADYTFHGEDYRTVQSRLIEITSVSATVPSYAGRL